AGTRNPAVFCKNQFSLLHITVPSHFINPRTVIAFYPQDFLRFIKEGRGAYAVFLHHSHRLPKHFTAVPDRTHPFFHFFLHAEAFYAEARAPNLQFGAAITGFATLRRKS